MEVLVEILKSLGQLIIALLVFAIGTERGTELVKVFIRFVGEKVPALDFSNARSFTIAAIVAGAATLFFGLDVTQYLTWLDGYDPIVVDLVNTLLITFVSGKLHDKYAKPLSGGAVG